MALSVYTVVFGFGALAASVAAALALRALGKRQGALPGRAASAWAALFGALIVACAVWGGIGRVEGGKVAYSVFVLVCAAGLALQGGKGLVRRALAEHPRNRVVRVAASGVAKAAALAAASALSVLALELPSNADLLLAGGVNPAGLGAELAMVAAALLAAYFLGQRTGGLAALVAAVCAGFGVAEHFVLLYKGQPITPGDLMAVGTAATVSGGYSYTLTHTCLWGLACFAGALALLSPAGLRSRMPARAEAQAPQPARPGAHFSPASGSGSTPAATGVPARPATRRIAGVVANVAVGVAVCAALALGVTRVDFIGDLGINLAAWEMQNSYRLQGYLAAFVANLQLVTPHAPDGYSDAAADELIASYAAAWDEANAGNVDRQAAEQQFSELTPSVVVVMNETFSDLSVFNELGCGYTGPAFTTSIADALATGSLAVSAQGGGTCNTEFEVLTGTSTGYIGSGVYPYQSYNLSHTDNLARTFKDLGYQTTAMHPNLATNWNRENAYKSLGFDEFLSIDDFAGAETLCGKVTDAATYDKVLELLSTGSEPQFILDVTMQNHLPYLSGGVPEEDRGNHVDWSVTDGESIPETNEYLDLIDASDRAFEEFLGELAVLDRPVVVLFFGDHQPAFSREYNDALLSGEDALEHEERLWETLYVLWANYGVAGNAQVSQQINTSTNYLGPLTLDLIGAPLSDWDKARLAVMADLPMANIVGWRDASGALHEHGDAGSQAYEDLRAMQFRKLFRPLGDGSNILAVQTQDASNW